jgi:hypothetical protein
MDGKRFLVVRRSWRIPVSSTDLHLDGFLGNAFHSCLPMVRFASYNSQMRNWIDHYGITVLLKQPDEIENPVMNPIGQNRMRSLSCRQGD